jgi:hypothetical protein
MSISAISTLCRMIAVPLGGRIADAAMRKKNAI